MATRAPDGANKTVKIFCIELDEITEGKSCTFFVVFLQVQLIKDKEREVRLGWCCVSPRLLT